MEAQRSLQDYGQQSDGCSQRGFMPSIRLPLPASHSALESLLRQPPLHLSLHNGTFRSRVKGFPILPLPPMAISKAQKYTILAYYAFAASAYIWGNKHEVILDTLPPQISIPLDSLAKDLDIAPIATYATCVLWNCYRIDTARGWELSNVAAGLTFTGSRDEELFYTIM